MNPIAKCIEVANGPVALTREMNKHLERPVTYQAVRKWVASGRLPRTEWTGETKYAQALSAAVGGKVTVEQLLKKDCDLGASVLPTQPDEQGAT